MWNAAFGATEKYEIMLIVHFLPFLHDCRAQLVTAMVANATNIFSLVTKTSGLVTILVTRFLYDLDLN